MPPEDPHDEPLPPKIGPYTVLRAIGRGAMGVVYSAYDDRLDRKIAVKHLHLTHDAGPQAEARLLREAQALARVSHPNVVQVYEVGEHRREVYIAMEFVAGQTLRAWARGVVRPWREVLGVYMQAGRGLAAAHAAGLVHRDFKPDNILIARDGRVRVLDFGLARSASDISPDELESDPAAAAVLASVSSERRERSQIEAALLTRTGALVGTPAYMSPEQHLGRYANPRSDQFSFCVALYQALYGVRPFVGERMSSLAFQVLQGKIGAVPAGSTVPTWLRRIVLRGLSVDPELRYPGMPELLADLDRHDRGGKRRRGFQLTSAALIGLGLWLGLRATAGAPELCRSALVNLRGTWDEHRIAALETAFRTSNLPYAAATWHAVRPTLQRYADEWAQAHTLACEDTHVRRLYSERYLDLRMACLERRRIELHELSEVLLRGDRAAIENASEGASRLGDLDACSDTAALDAVVAPPTRELALAVERVTANVARASALELAARWSEAQDLTTAALAEPAAREYPPLQAAALRVHARVQRRLGVPADAADSLRAATRAAAAGRDDRAAADAWIDLVYIAGTDLNQPVLTSAYSLAADDAVLRSGNDPLQRARVDATIFAAQIRLGTPDLAAGQRALEYFDAHPGADPTLHHRLLIGLGLVHTDRREARALYLRALELGRSHYGHDHPNNAVVLSNLAILASSEDRPGEARNFADEAAAIRRVLPVNHLDHADTEECYATLADAREDTASAADHYRRALAIYQSRRDPPPSKVGAVRNNLAFIADLDGRQRDAIPEYRAALAAFRAIAPDGEHAVTVEDNLTQALIAVGEYSEAQPLQDHVVEHLQARHGGLHPLVAAARMHQARILRALGKANDARAILEAAIPALERAGPDYRGRRGLARYTLARCLADLQTSRAQQASLLELAAADLDGDDDPTSQRALDELQAWRPTTLPRAPRTR